MELLETSLEWLLAPVTTDVFVTEYWEKRPLHVQRDSPDYYSKLLTPADFDGLLSSLGSLSRGLRVVHEGREAKLINGFGATAHMPNLEEIYAHYRKGATISFTHIHDRWPPLSKLCQRLSDTFSATFQVNAYLTPRRSQGLNKHYDTHDVFVVQVAGSKNWQLGSYAIRLPLPYQEYDRDAASSVDFEQKIELHPGDMLYVPRGLVHEAASTESASLHLTVGVFPITWADALLAEIERILESPEFRAALPFGFSRPSSARNEAEHQISDLAAKIFEQFSPVRSIGNAADILSRGRPSVLTDHLLDLEALHAIDNETRVVRRPGLQWEIMSDEADIVKIKFNAKVVSLPGHLNGIIQFMATGDRFTASQLPGNLDDESRLTVVKRLVEEGFLTLSRHSP